MSNNPTPSHPAIPPQKVQKIYEAVCEAFPEGISISNITKAVTSLMQIVGEIKAMRGSEKKAFVVDMLIHIIDTSPTGDTLDVLSPFVIHNVPLLVDSLIEVEKGRLVFNTKTKGCILQLFACS